jgi:glycosyltransferase involved in cell wall biosynthesis
LGEYIREHDIGVLHAHSTSLFTAVLAALQFSQARVIWHDHYGGPVDRRVTFPYKLLTRRVNAVIAVNEALAAWAREKLRLPSTRVCYIPNFASLEQHGSAVNGLPGVAGKRIVCVANLREQKDHLTLIRAMASVTRRERAAHLLLVGSLFNAECVERIRKEIATWGLEQSISFLGVRQDISAVLGSCDIGVLSSYSEGLPVALLEYGAARLPAVVTRVGQCEEVLDGGKAGILVSPGDPDSLAEALLALLASHPDRNKYANRLHRRIVRHYSQNAVMARVMRLYGAVLVGIQ